MKLSYKQIEPFLKQPDPGARAVLVYGPDEGLVRVRGKILAKHVVEDVNDPFNATQFSMESLGEEPGKLIDELAAGSMMGGARVVMVEQASDSLTSTIKTYLENPSLENMLIVMAGNLAPKSSLRQLFEKDKAAAALPCYVQDQGALKPMISQKIVHAGYQIDPDALIYMANSLVGDHAQAMSELEKLILYMGWPQGYEGFESEPAQSGQGKITLTDVQNNTGNLSEQKLDALCDIVGLGHIQAIDETLSLLLAEETSPIVIIRSLMYHFKSIHVTNLKVAQGENMKAAVKSLYPPIFFKREQAFFDQLNRWGVEKSSLALEKLNECEAMLKTNIKTPELLLSRCLISLAALSSKKLAA